MKQTELENQTQQDKTEPVKEAFPLNELEEKKQKIDITPYLGKTTTIETVAVKKTKDGRWALLVETRNLETDTEKPPMRARRFFSLQEDEKGTPIYTPKSKFAEYLQGQGLKRPEDLKGKTVLTSQRIDKQGNVWLSF